MGVLNSLANSPIIVKYWKSYHGESVVSDANLNQYEFAKAVDPFQARQQIEQFLRNDLVKDLDIPIKISDKDRIKAHGFDLKTSFRKDTAPTRKKKK